MKVVDLPKTSRPNRKSRRQEEERGAAQETLQPLFEKLNARYFSGRVSPYRVELVDHFEENPAIRDDSGVGGITLSSVRTIIVAKRTVRLEEIRPNQIRRILLHEMCHAVGLYMGHDKYWRAEMRRLAAMGEDWAAVQVSLYDPGEWEDWCDDALTDTPDFLTTGIDSPLPPYKTAEEVLAGALRLELSTFRRVVPGVEAWYSEQMSARLARQGSRRKVV